MNQAGGSEKPPTMCNSSPEHFGFVFIVKLELGSGDVTKT